MKKSVLILSFALLSFFIFNNFHFFNSIVPVWTYASDISTPVRAGNTASYAKDNNGWLFIVSGRDQNEAIIKTVQRYNINSNTWDTLNPHPTGLLGAAAAVLKDSLYIIGGVINPPGAGENTVYKFSINQNLWSAVANFPVSIVDAKAVSYQDSIIYTAGGVGGPVEQNIYMYNSNTDSWRTATPFPANGRRNFGGFAVTGDTLIYMCGTNAFGSSIYYDSVYVGVIDQSDRSVIYWTRGANFPGQTRTFFDACSWGANGIIMTGGSTDNTFNSPGNECYTFSPGNNIWTQLPDKPTAWLTGQSGTVKLSNGIWKLICASGYDSVYLSQTEILTDTISTVGISNNNSQLPEKFELAQNYPNPFNPSTSLEFGIANPQFVTLKIFDMLGNEIKTLVSEIKPPGRYSVKFDGSNLPSGNYFYKLTAGEFSTVKKMTLLK